MTMKKQILYAATMLLFVGCASDDSDGYSNRLTPGAQESLQGVYGYMPSYEFGDQEGGHATRVTLTAGESGLSFAWEAGNVINVVGEINDNQQSTTHCAMPSTSSGRLRTSFDGGAFTLNPNAMYYSFYPYNSNTDATANRQITLRSQVQTGNNSTGHLGEKNYMVAPKVTTDDNGSCLFHFTNVLSPCRFTLTLPASAENKTVSELTVTRYGDNNLYFPTRITEDFSNLNSEDGENIKAIGMTYNEGTDADYKQYKQTLDFTDCTIGSDHVLVAWMMLFPKSHSTGRYHVTVRCSDGTVYAGNVAGKDLVGGKAYRFSTTLAEHIEMSTNVAWAVRNEGATLPYDKTNMTTYANLSDAVKAALPTVTDVEAMIANCDCLFGQGYNSSGKLVSGVYFRAKNGNDSNPAGNVIFLPLTGESYGYYWLKDGGQYLKFDSGATPTIVAATTSSTAAVRTVTR